MFKQFTRQEAINNQSHLKALGLDSDVFLNEGDFPFELATDCKEGGTHRIDISTDVWFYAEESGIKFRTSLSLEKYNASGKSGYHFNIDKINEVIKLLPSDTKIKFKKYLSECVKSIQKQGRIYQDLADKQFSDASILKELTKSK